MTDQTVPVPVDLLQTLKDVYRGGAGYDAHDAIADILDLIPAPLKAGDVLTDAAQITDLPDTTVIVDRDRDVYVVGNGTATRVTDQMSLSSEVRPRAELGAYGFSAYGPFTLHYVPDNA